MDSTDVVVITGASSGFGAALAERLAKRGAKLVLAARRRDRLEALAATLDADTHLVTLDVRDETAVKQAFSELPPNFRDVTVLVNNAGLALGMGPAQDAALDDWTTMVDTNVKGLLHCTHAVLPGFVARKRGHLLNIGSVAATYPYPGGHVYAGTKAFVHQFSLALRADLLGTGVRVGVLEAGMVETEFSQVRFKGDEARANAVYKGVSALTAADMAETIEFMLDRPAHVNINTLEVMCTEQAFSPFAVYRS